VGCGVTFTQTSLRRAIRTTMRPYSNPKLMVGTTKRSMAAMSVAWLRRKVRQVWEGGPRRLTIYLRQSTEPLRNRASAIRHECAARPTTGSRRSSGGLGHEARILFLVGRCGGGTSSAESDGSPTCAIGQACPDE